MVKRASYAGPALSTGATARSAISAACVVHGWLMAAPDTTGTAPAPARHPRWAAQRLGRGGRRDPSVPTAPCRTRVACPHARPPWIRRVRPRSSTEPSTAARGRADLADFIEPIDQLIAEGIADPERLAVAGYSYGGVATCALLAAHADRFAAAAVAGGLICDLASIAGQRLLRKALFASATAVHVDRPVSRAHRELSDGRTRPAGEDTHARAARRERQHLPDRTGAAVVLGTADPGCADSPGGLSRRQPPLHRRRRGGYHRVDYHARVVEWVELHTRAAAPAGRAVAGPTRGALLAPPSGPPPRTARSRRGATRHRAARSRRRRSSTTSRSAPGS